MLGASTEGPVRDGLQTAPLAVTLPVVVLPRDAVPLSRTHPLANGKGSSRAFVGLGAKRQLPGEWRV